MTDTARAPENSVPGGRPAGNAAPALRRIVLVVAGAEAVFLLIYMALFAGNLGSGEALSRNIAQAVLMLTAIPAVLLVLPALVLGIMNRALKLALSFALLALPLGVLLFLFA